MKAIKYLRASACFLLCLFVLCDFAGAGEYQISQPQRDYINTLQRDGLLRMEWEYHKAYISSPLWEMIDAQVKEALAFCLAVRCSEMATQTKGTWVHIYDMQSGKKIAKWNSWGFEAY